MAPAMAGKKSYFNIAQCSQRYIIAGIAERRVHSNKLFVFEFIKCVEAGASYKCKVYLTIGSRHHQSKKKLLLKREVSSIIHLLSSTGQNIPLELAPFFISDFQKSIEAAHEVGCWASKGQSLSHS